MLWSPSHYGSTATARGKIFLHPPIRSPSHYGSTATIEAIKAAGLQESLHPTMVRLQPTPVAARILNRNGLHPTMVRLQQRATLKIELIQASSPSHYGSTATRRYEYDTEEASKSPSHYGSTATWLYRVTIKLELSLHPTMVRLQQRR